MMKHKIRDNIIFLIDICGASALYRSLTCRRGPLVRVIVFHDVPDALWFESVLSELTKQYHLISPREFHTRTFHPEKINVLLTFDDGYDSWVRVCAPLLKKYNAKGLFFITTGLLDTAENEKENRRFMKEQFHIHPKASLTWSGARTLLLEGHTVGGHTHTHPNLALVSSSVAQEEIITNKQLLEARLGTTLVDFAYPFGRKKHRNKEVLQLLRECGYQNIYTADPGFVHNNTQEIPRMCIEKRQSPEHVIRWIEGAYDIFSYRPR